MAQEPPPENDEEEQEQLSGTLYEKLSSSLQGLSDALGWLSAALVVVGVVALVVGLALLGFFDGLRLYSYIIMGIGAGLLVTAATLSFPTVAGAVTGRRGRYSTNTVLMVSAFVGIVAVGNYLAFEYTHRSDVTATRQFQLAPRTVNLLKNLGQDVEAKVFFAQVGSGQASSQQEQTFEQLLELFRSQLDDLLREFEARSGKFSYEFIDPNLEPGVARVYQALGPYPSIVFEGKDPGEGTDTGKLHQVPLTTAVQTLLFTGLAPIESQLVTGLLIVTGREQKQVYYLSGHGERDGLDIDDSSEGFGFALGGIEGENYGVRTLNLLLESNRQVLLTGDALEGEPEGNGDEKQTRVSLLVVAGPSGDLLTGDLDEAEVLDEYLRRGGNILMLLDPDTKPRFREFAARWGIVLADGRIADASRNYGDKRQNILLLSRPPNQFLEYIPAIAYGLEAILMPDVAALQPAEGVDFLPRLDEEEEEDETERLNIRGRPWPAHLR